MIRKDLNDQIFRTSQEKDIAITEKVIELHKTGQPILIFTSSINKSEIYSKLLKKVKIKHIVLNAKNHENEAEIIANAGKLNSVIITTSISGRGVDIQLGGKKGSHPDNELIKNKAKIKSIGGLFVIGTERMESRRVDNQARGRSGRQGDEGGSIFYVSLDDDLMRIFGSDSMNNILQKLGLKDGESIDHPWINKALERAQQKVEARNFDIRKTLLKFDDVLNDQRHVIFSQRNHLIDNGDKVFEYSNEYLSEILELLIDLKKKDMSLSDKSSKFHIQLRTILSKKIDEEELQIIKGLNDNEFKKKIESFLANSRNKRINIIGEEKTKVIEKDLFIDIIDQHWQSHIQYLEQLRQVIGLRSYGQRDPLVEYKKESFKLFENLLFNLKNYYISVLINLDTVLKNPPEEEIKLEPIDPKFIGKSMRRNEPCLCGSGKKYKKCCGAL